MNQEIETWEGEGGASAVVPRAGLVTLTGTESQVEWAERIRLQVDADFERVASALRATVAAHGGAQREDTQSILAILEDKRAEVMAREQAGYFIHDWQELGDQVRQLIFSDARYAAIQQRRRSRKRVAV